MSGISFSDVQVTGCCNVALTLRGDRTTMTFTGTLRGDSLSGALREEAPEGRFAFARAPTAAASLDEREITLGALMIYVLLTHRP
ncbi:MAG: hypothetical protein ACT4PJ_03835 [Gemmatimonadaceae bacterium]